MDSPIKETKGEEADEGKSEQSGASITLDRGPVKMEKLVNVEQTNHHALEGNPIVMDSNRNVGVFDVENNKPRNAICGASEIDGSFEVEAICGGAEGEKEGQVSEDESVGNYEAPVSGSGDANQESLSNFRRTDQNEFLPISLPTAASVSRWVEGDQLHKVDSEETWLPASLPEERGFACICWHVDWDGLITVSTTVQQEGLRVISTVLEAKFGGSEASSTDVQGWKKGDRCIANFHLDGGWYRGVVTRVKTHHMVDRDQVKAYVQFVDYGSTSWVDVTKLRRGSCMSDLPIQSIRLKMKDLVPMNLTTWDKKALDLLHATLVDRHLKVEVD